MTQANDPVWERIRQEAAHEAQQEPILASFFHATILNHRKLECALSFHLASKLDSPTVHALLLREVIMQAFESDPELGIAVRQDLLAVEERDSACHELSVPFLHFKGFHALQTYRVANWLWRQGRHSLALFFQNRMSSEFDVDIHPAAKLGHGIMLDHATGLVIGETAVVGNNVSMLHAVTLGGTGKDDGVRHPKIADGVLIGAGAKVLGNITVGMCSRIAAGSVVLHDVPSKKTVAGVPAKIVGESGCATPSVSMDHYIDR